MAEVNEVTTCTCSRYVVILPLHVHTCMSLVLMAGPAAFKLPWTTYCPTCVSWLALKPADSLIIQLNGLQTGQQLEIRYIVYGALGKEYYRALTTYMYLHVRVLISQTESCICTTPNRGLNFMTTVHVTHNYSQILSQIPKTDDISGGRFTARLGSTMHDASNMHVHKHFTDVLAHIKHTQHSIPTSVDWTKPYTDNGFLKSQTSKPLPTTALWSVPFHHSSYLADTIASVHFTTAPVVVYGQLSAIICYINKEWVGRHLCTQQHIVSLF